MARYFATATDVTFDCGVVTVRQITSSPQHLWLLWTTRIPGVNPIPDRRQNNTVPHQNNLTLWIEHITEQNEPGNTFIHTFTFDWPAGAEILFLYSINKGTGGLKASRSPIFAFELKQTALIDEDWSAGLTGHYNWETDGSIDNDFITSPNTLVMRTNAGGGASVTLVLADILSIREQPICNLMMQATGHLLQKSPGQFVGMLFNFQDSLSSEQTYFQLNWAINPTNPCAFGGVDYTAINLNKSGGRDTNALTTLYNSPNVTCQNRPDRSLFPLPFFVTLYSLTLGTPVETLPYSAMFGPFRIYTVAGELTDISREWRRRRLSPKLP